ncbi:hypothetical protein Acr_00g0036690 [Actinidia rufa]|uniref:Uncharacterized protein n=1 Tax=Actinidia rufa TaxID=165716 RepID=A0A7J0DGN0_9ERIC|nr:hypothetical protein Acr_00g0036690 [Actinidia rufa]
MGNCSANLRSTSTTSSSDNVNEQIRRREREDKRPTPRRRLIDVAATHPLGGVQCSDFGVAHVEVLGQSLFPSFDVEILELSGKFVLKYYPLGQNSSPPVLPYSQLANSPNLLPENLRDLEQLLNMLNGNAPDLDPYDWDDDDNDIDLVLM